MIEFFKGWFERYEALVHQDTEAMIVGTVLLVVVLSILVHFLDRRRLVKRIQSNLPGVIGNYREKTVTKVIEKSESTLSGRPEVKSKIDNMPWPVYFRFLRYVAIKTIDNNPKFLFHSMGLGRLFGYRRKRNITPVIPPSNEIFEGWWKKKDNKEYGHCHSCGSNLTLDNNILKCPNCGETFPPILAI